MTYRFKAKYAWIRSEFIDTRKSQEQFITKAEAWEAALG